jgi:hypothetical protein
MEKEFVPYELQLEIENLCLDEPCFGVYGKSEKKLFLIHKDVFDEVDKNHFIKAYTYQQAFRCFREKYGLVISIPPSEQNNLIEFKGIIYIYKQIRLGNSVDILHCKFYNSHEEAELECLKKLIEIVKNSRL